MKKYQKLCLALLSLLPSTTFAADYGKLGEYGKSGTQDVGDFLNRIKDWLLGFVGGLALLFIVYGGFLYITSGGNKDRIETAKKTLTYAILGLILVALSGVIFTIINGDFLTSIFGNKSL